MTIPDLERKVVESLARFDAAVRGTTLQTDDRSIEAARGSPARERCEELALKSSSNESKRETPQCRPWNYDDFLERLRSFTPLNWFAKPWATSPPVCARHGWTNPRKDLLICQCCRAELSWDGDASKQSFLSKLSSAHHDLCPWLDDPCPREFLQVPSFLTKDWVKAFRRRLISLRPLVQSDALPEIARPESFEERCKGNLKSLAAKVRRIEDGIERHTSERRDTPGSDRFERNSEGATDRFVEDDVMSRNDWSKVDDEVLGVASALAVFGWEDASSSSSGTGRSIPGVAHGGQEDAISPSNDVQRRLRCSICNRRVAVSNFLGMREREDTEIASSMSDKAEQTVAARQHKRRRLSGGGTPVKPMHLVREHRSFCSFAAVHPGVQGETPEEVTPPGWAQTVDAILSWEHSELPAKTGTLTSEKTDTSHQAEEAYNRFQEVLNVLLRY